MAARNGGMKDENPVSPKKNGQKPPVKKEQAPQPSPQKMKTRASPVKTPAGDEDSQPASKRLKIDHDEQVA